MDQEIKTSLSDSIRSPEYSLEGIAGDVETLILSHLSGELTYWEDLMLEKTEGRGEGDNRVAEMAKLGGSHRLTEHARLSLTLEQD